MLFRLHHGLENARQAPWWVTLETFVADEWTRALRAKFLLIAFRHKCWGALEVSACARAHIGRWGGSHNTMFFLFTRQQQKSGLRRATWMPVLSVFSLSHSPSGSCTTPYWGGALISNTSSVCQPPCQPAASPARLLPNAPKRQTRLSRPVPPAPF